MGLFLGSASKAHSEAGRRELTQRRRDAEEP
jgi:hypothetical protein